MADLVLPLRGEVGVDQTYGGRFSRDKEAGGALGEGRP